ncbi:LytTR family DNA-binding domain-containing protein [Tellurirhabdus bombi]|uniref:LytTR family DNA-binding domain-containing protein n=1 Tax=Tellurirhabdus bombi TaxID=2907205 RepID=UPI001F21B479|nr:LytTR family DNA-binding domain-containing protein [Tellurirhabdus bombi]
MFSVLRQPYPVEEPRRQRWRKAFFIGLFVGVFLLIFQPFGLAEWATPNKIAKVLGFGLITFVVTAINFFVPPLIAPRLFTDQHWTVGKEITWVILNILLIGVANRLYLAWLIGDYTHGSWIGAILVTFIIGIFPVTASVVLGYIVKLKKYTNSAASLPVHEATEINDPTVRVMPLTLVAENEKDLLTLLSSDLLFIESSDNYSTVTYLKNGQPTKLLLRSSLSRLEGQLADQAGSEGLSMQEAIVRCHRSYIVNLAKIEKVTGNAQGYKLHLLEGQFQIPVARKYNESLVRQLKALA